MSADDLKNNDERDTATLTKSGCPRGCFSRPDKLWTGHCPVISDVYQGQSSPKSSCRAVTPSKIRDGSRFASLELKEQASRGSPKTRAIHLGNRAKANRAREMGKRVRLEIGNTSKFSDC
ncbi:hypothetical protein RRG08_032057 [Elysia crispata]|uniref:Uncharacterized protein n=1 Tax=Elysia crispata TaxID=231223 RepID=A0AAE1DFW9_9GAST|nr:hypothetical protein RRG08_032057 [Elysia crispata]